MTLPDDEIAIIGTGTFGLSTALYLSRQGYTNITCYDKDKVPSYYSAGNDSNKIVDADEEDTEDLDPDDKLALEAKKLWQTDPVYSPYYHPTGFFYAASDPVLLDSFQRIKDWKKAHPDAKMIRSAEAFKENIPALTGEFPGWYAYKLGTDDGWLHARNSLISVYEACKGFGVKFVFGPNGEIDEFLSKGDQITGVKAKSGAIHTAKEYVLTCGANAPRVFNMKGQMQPKCWTVAHIKLEKSELERFRGLPVLFNVQRGFFFEPDENDEIKICNEFPGYTMFHKNGDSLPFWTDSIPEEAAVAVRQLLKDVLPELADRPFVKTKICWCSDSADRTLMIDTPGYSNMVVGSGDSGKSFMLMPVIGKYIGKVVMSGTESLTASQCEAWRWRPETSGDFDETQGRYGGSGKIKDLTSIKLWVSVDNPTPHTVNLGNSK